ncbi:hypothetical protein [Persicobacter psychrovividus]|uniref:Uncharacterized protein n=1 Tax=Persicobacter psychrovividus TaxID=387638 RepID=A0ABM7VE87_9BACT|nr:hypothetical protein PEPS_14290 [Persicobacter psychrovividus]
MPKKTIYSVTALLLFIIALSFYALPSEELPHHSVTLKVDKYNVRIKKIFVAGGAAINKGDQVLLLESPTVEKNLWMARESIHQTQVKLIQLRTEKQTLLTMLQPKKLNSSFDLKIRDAIENEMLDIRVRFNMEERQLKQRLKEFQAEEQYWTKIKKELLIKTPIDGVVKGIEANCGDFLSENDPLISISPS